MATKPHKCPEQEEFENPDRYLGSYADMITILLVLFIVLFAFGQIDLAKFEEFKQGFARSGATPPVESALLLGGESAIENTFDIVAAIITVEGISVRDGDPAEGPVTDGDTDDSESEDTLEPEGGDAAQRQLEDVQRSVSDSLEGVTIGTDVRFKLERRGLVITIVSDQVLFAPGSATLTTQGTEIVDSLGTSLEGLPNEISVEGHTDSRPISTPQFPSNWELSVGRASSVLRSLVDDHGFPPAKLSASGYADQRPVATNETVEGRAANRRVEVVILSLADQTAPQIAEP